MSTNPIYPNSDRRKFLRWDASTWSQQQRAIHKATLNNPRPLLLPVEDMGRAWHEMVLDDEERLKEID